MKIQSKLDSKIGLTMNLSTLLFFALFTAFSCGDTSGGTQNNNENNGENNESSYVVGRLKSEGNTNAVSVSSNGKLAYLSDGFLGMLVVDIQDPTSPKLIATFTSTVSKTLLSTDEKSIFLASGPKGIQILNIQDPKNPTLISEIDTPGSALDIVLSKDGTTLFVADATNGLQLVDVKDPKTPSLLSAYTDPSIGKSVALSADNKTLYLADRQGTEVLSLDVTNPLKIKEIGKATMDSTPLNLLLTKKNELFIADGQQGIQHLAGDLSLINKLDTTTNFGLVESLVEYKSKIYAAGFGGILVVDPSGSELKILNQIRTTGLSTAGLAVQKGFLYVANGGDGFVIIDLDKI